ncbi:MAG: hypothetical protein GY711_00750 [bacterium]|nr:hypothetical protein [bacterium]
MTDQRAVRGASRMGGMTSSADARWLFQSEGSTVVFLRTNKQSGPHDRRRMHRVDGEKRAVIGESAITVSRMMLDPAADASPGPNTPGNVRNLFYLAGGRDGLWIMEADVALGVQNKAWRIDDASNALNPSVQDNVRWCCDVGLTTVAGVDYLVALFAEKEDSKLRLYRMSDVRAVADPANANNELGNELAATIEVTLGQHDTLPPPPSARSLSHSVALSMDIDTVATTPGQESADAFVAMGSNGLAKVSLSGPGPNAVLRWGPIFGTGSYYEGGGGIPANKSRELYGNLVIEEARRYTTPDDIMREEYPTFSDVAVFRGLTQQGQPVHHLYAAVDHLFWVVFDLGTSNFDHDTPILHHEGFELDYVQQWGTLAQKVVKGEPSGTVASCAREIKIAQHPQRGPYVIVTTSWINYVKDFAIFTNEGHVFNSHLEWGGGIGRIPSKQRAYWYKIQANYGSSPNSTGVIGSGGSTLHVPSEQGDSERVKFFHTGRIEPWDEGPLSRNGVGLVLARAEANGPSTRQFSRSISHSAGRHSFPIGTSMLDRDVIFTGDNDGAVPKDGFLALNGSDIKRHYQPTSGFPRVDERGPGGFFFDNGSQWQEPGQAFDRHWIFCSGSNRNYNEGTPPFWTQIRWQLMEMRIPGLDGYVNSPVRERWWYFTPPRDGFGNLGFIWYMNAHVNPRFDLFLDQAGRSERLAFGTHIRTAQGLTVIDRDEMMAHAQTQGNGRDLHFDSGFAQTQGLVTHPEYNNMPRGDSTLRSFWQATLGGNSDDTSVAFTWAPRVIEVQAPGTNDFGRWVLAVPCGHIYSNPDWDIYTDPGYGNPAWQPDAGSLWDQSYSHGFVQFWEIGPSAAHGGDYWPLSVTDPGLDNVMGTSDDVGGNSPLRKIIAPDPDTNIWKVVPLRMSVGGSEQVFLVCVDFAGHVYVYTITDILDVVPSDPSHPVDGRLSSQFLRASWTAPPSTIDDLQTNVFDVAADYRGGDTANLYVATRRVGVIVLEFDPLSQTPLTEINRFQTPDYPVSLHVRQDTDKLLVNDYGGGIRVYGD